MRKCMSFNFTLQHIAQFLWLLCSMCFQLYPFTCLHVSMLLCCMYMQFPVWSSALVRTDSQSNALTPSICSMVTSLMVVSYICGCKLLMILVMFLTRHILNLPMQFKVRCSMVRSPHLWLSCWHPVFEYITIQWSLNACIGTSHIISLVRV